MRRVGWILLGLTASIAAMHAPMLWRSHGACPFGFDQKATPEAREAARAAFARSHRGEARAAARPALGLALDRTTRADVTAWATAHGAHCESPKAGPDLECSAIADPLLPIERLWLGFGANGTLISAIAVRRAPTAGAMKIAFDALTRALEEDAGPASSSDGDSAHLANGPLQQASAEFRFSNYYALARATNMGDGLTLTEEYRSLPD
jgi:hypothetical protein